MKYMLFIVLFLTSCASIPPHTNPPDYICYVPSIDNKPFTSLCPKCKNKGYYIQSFIMNEDYKFLIKNYSYSQYVCPKSHEWFIGKNNLNDIKIQQVVIIK